MTTNAIYQSITDRIVAKLQEGTVPWRKPWKSSGLSLPLSVASGKPYSGINVWLLIWAAQDNGYTSPYWATFNQIKKLGGSVKAGSKATQITLWKRTERDQTDENTGETKKVPGVYLTTYNVFNADQTTKLPSKYYVEAAPEVEPEVIEAQRQEALNRAEEIAQGYLAHGPAFTHGVDGRAWYSPGLDLVSIPVKGDFHSPEEYYSTLAHELTHSTGHKSRLEREGITEAHYFGDQSYSKEELVAEFGAAFFCGLVGIEQVTLDNSASYIAHWISKLQEDPKLLIQAAQQSQKALDLITGRVESQEVAA